MVVRVEATLCPACGSSLSREHWSEGLCPGCLFELALESPSLAGELEHPNQENTLAYSREAYRPGQVLGKRYRIRALLGRGGMGEVWRAYDLKLRVDVALKALRRELLADPRALETLRQEVRVAREVVSPNVCRVFDLVELEGRELVSMEYIEGITLATVLEARAPLELTEAQEIAAQFLSGLGAIHEAGLVHRDVKPENLMMTRSGRVVLMDFGIAKGLAEGPDTVSGTPAYMAPEQSRGEVLDARADIFAAGVVLAEMIAPEGHMTFEARQKVWQGIHHEPPEIADSPWTPVLRAAVARRREERPVSAANLVRALEEVTLRVAGDEDVHPYPGLASFSEEDAEYFFGRELEVEEMWKKLQRPHLLGLIGPSGAGKSSFLRAGLMPAIPTGWRALVATPGSQPFIALARVLASELAGDEQAVQDLLEFDDVDVAVSVVARWRRRSDEALIVIDQFEELFTQNPQEIQARFAELLGRLAIDADAHVLLSMRDDFLFHCQPFESLAPVFSEMTPLGPPTGTALRRAIVQPALKCGYRFEDESLVEAMLAEVEGERGALPMLAFAAARMWQHRDREQGLLTREAYEVIGGVGGALAQHAEATLKRIGQDRIPLVREIFRNLVTAQGTRAARDREELLSVFDADGPAAGVLNTLVDARLLTSYEVPGADNDTGHHRIEIVHESLLTNWPRLVRWQTQDQEGAQLRDELRQQARLWDQHHRSPDYLWTGTAFKEYELWCERYPGAVSTTEEAFGQAMTAHAERRKRRRRLVVASVVLLALAVAMVMGGLWLRSEAETRRAEASKLLALAQLKHEGDPTEALAYTTASLELADSEEARIFALRLLWEGPPALEVEAGNQSVQRPSFSPDGSRLAAAGWSDEVRVWAAEGGAPLVLPEHIGAGRGISAQWSSNELLVTGPIAGLEAYLWNLAGAERVRTIDFGAPTWWQVGGRHLLAEVNQTDVGQDIWDLVSWRLPDGSAEDLNRFDWAELGRPSTWFDSDGSGWVYSKGSEVHYRPLPARDGLADRLIGSHENDAVVLRIETEGDRIWTQDKVTSELRFWDLTSSEREPLRIVARPTGLEEGAGVDLPDPSGRWVNTLLRQASLWNPGAWVGSRPLALRRSGSWFGASSTFHPSGNWVVVSTNGYNRLTFWPLHEPRPIVVDGYANTYTRPVAFSSDSRWLATGWPDQSLRIWPLPGSGAREVRTVPMPKVSQLVDWRDLVFDPEGRSLFIVGFLDDVYVVPLDSSPPRRLEIVSDQSFLSTAAVSPSGRYVATAFRSGPKGKCQRTLRVWDLETDELRLFNLPESSEIFPDVDLGVGDLAFLDESTLYTSGNGGVLRWDLDTGVHEVVLPAKTGSTGTYTAFRPGERTALVLEPMLGDQHLGLARILDLATGESRDFSAFATTRHRSLELWPRNAFDASAELAAVGDSEGIIRVARLSGGEPHLLVGHEGPVDYLAISPDEKWIASSGEDNTLRLWPMPDLDEPPLHSLPRDELIEKLRSLTNIRVVRDPESPEGWSFALDPFPGWAEVPEW